MTALYAIGGIWAAVAALVLTAAVILVPPRDVREFGLHLQVGLGWPWFLGFALWGWAVGHDIEADR